jgi:hypothetical protein
VNSLMNITIIGNFAGLFSFKSSKKVKMNNITAPLLNDKSSNDRRPCSRRCSHARSLKFDSSSATAGVESWSGFSTSTGSMRK